MNTQRRAALSRKTAETEIELELCLDGTGESRCSLGIGFLEHMLCLMAYHGKLDLEATAKADLHVDDHHLVEDLGIALGRALAQALGDKRGIQRYGSLLLPMDEVLVAAAVDVSGRFAFSTNYSPTRDRVGELSTEMVPHFFQSLASESRMALHLQFLNAGSNEHHRIEAMFKAFGRALRAAVRVDTEMPANIPSTKGIL